MSKSLKISSLEIKIQYFFLRITISNNNDHNMNDFFKSLSNDQIQTDTDIFKRD